MVKEVSSMSGHSKWAQIKHKKSKMDRERGRLFSKLIREITVAARMGGGDVEGNPRLRAAIQAAKAANMPQENIERAIKRGTGELPGVNYEDVVYEGYGPSGVALMVEVTTDNRKRTVAEIRHLFEKYGGHLGEGGSVSWMFETKGLIVVEKDAVDEETLMMVALDAGAEDIRDTGDSFEVITEPGEFEGVKRALDANGIQYTHAELTRLPQTTVHVEGKDAERLIGLLEALEDHDDVRKVYSNFEMDDALMEALTK